jgi:hypothetical protein
MSIITVIKGVFYMRYIIIAILLFSFPATALLSAVSKNGSEKLTTEKLRKKIQKNTEKGQCDPKTITKPRIVF